MTPNRRSCALVTLVVTLVVKLVVNLAVKRRKERLLKMTPNTRYLYFSLLYSYFTTGGKESLPQR